MNPIKDQWESPDGSVRLILGDCLEVLPTLSGIDAVVKKGLPTTTASALVGGEKIAVILTDPPYGINYVGHLQNAIDYGKIANDDKQFDPSPWLSFPFVVLWGANNYADKLPIGGWICWDKRLSEAADKILGSPFELAWCSRRTLFKIIRVLHGGAKNADAPRGDVANQKRYHPTQKPVRVMQSCLEFAPMGTVADPYMGSGTTGVACIRTGRRFVGIEIEEKYFRIAVKRIKAELERFPLFEPPKPKQLELIP